MSDPRTIVAVFELLYPLAFDRRQRRPLKLGIHHELIAAGHDVAGVKAGLRYYVNGYGYLRALQAGAARIDLAGQPSGSVTDQEAKHASQAVRKIAAKRKAQKPVRSAGDGLAALREAARERRQHQQIGAAAQAASATTLRPPRRQTESKTDDRG